MVSTGSAATDRLITVWALAADAAKASARLATLGTTRLFLMVGLRMAGCPLNVACAAKLPPKKSSVVIISRRPRVGSLTYDDRNLRKRSVSCGLFALAHLPVRDHDFGCRRGRRPEGWSSQARRTGVDGGHSHPDLPSLILIRVANKNSRPSGRLFCFGTGTQSDRRGG